MEAGSEGMGRAAKDLILIWAPGGLFLTGGCGYELRLGDWEDVT